LNDWRLVARNKKRKRMEEVGSGQVVGMVIVQPVDEMR
jgi:hypothetical protein